MTETLFRGRYNPCKGCEDRYPACSDHCQKEEFLAYQKEQALIRENRRKYNEAWAYTLKEMAKNRRVR